MNEHIYVLDFSYEVKNGTPSVYIWGINSKNERCIVIDQSFRPYFYVVPEERSGAEEVRKSLLRRSLPRSPILAADPVRMKFYGKPLEVIKVVTQIPDAIREYRELKVEGVKEVLEADIRFTMRYAIDREIYPFTWYEMNIEETERKAEPQVDRIYNLKSIIGRAELKRPELKVMAFDIEVYNKMGFPDPKRDPVIVIGTWEENGGKEFVMEGEDDKPVIEAFVNYVRSRDPDVIVGYNSNDFDIPYLLERGEVLGVELNLGRTANGRPNKGTYGHFSIPGRLNVDLFGFASNIAEVKIKSLDNVADYLGVMPRSNRVNLEWNEISKYWELKEKRDLVIKYNRDDVLSTYLLSQVFLPFGIQLSAITGMPLDQLCMASVGHRVEWLMIREAKKYGELIPNRVEREYSPYKGGLVISPRPGIHEMVYVLDFTSMYPSIMIKFNIGPDTLAPRECEDCWEAPEVGHKFVKEPPGFYKLVLQRLLDERRKIRESLSSITDQQELRILDERQRAIKVMSNAFYGYMGWIGARWYSREGAEAVTAWGRQIITDSIRLAKEMGFEIIYGDTDSIFLKGRKDRLQELIEGIERRNGIEIKIDKIYKRIFFTENKKRYAGLTIDGKIEVVGFEAVRGDWCELAKETQSKVIETLLTTGDVSKAVEVVRSVIAELKSNKIQIHKLVIWKSLEKDLEEYEVTAPHMIAAKKAIKMGYSIGKGKKIGYVVLRGSGKLAERVEPYFTADQRRIDIEYYVTRQVIPASMRVLEGFGVKEQDLTTSSRKSDITKFFS